MIHSYLLLSQPILHHLIPNLHHGILPPPSLATHPHHLLTSLLSSALLILRRVQRSLRAP